MCIPPCRHHNNPPFKLFDSCKPVVLLVVLIDYLDDISISKRRKNRGYTYLCAKSVICVSLLRAPQYSTFACCLTPVLTLVVLLVMLDDIDDISFRKRRYFLITSQMSISVYCIPTRDTHITRDMCMGIHISRGYTYHCDTGNRSHDNPPVQACALKTRRRFDDEGKTKPRTIPVSS